MTRECISGGSTIRLARDLVSSSLRGGEVVILSLNTGLYYGLDDVGACIWNLLKEPRTVNEIRDGILEEYDVELGECERDLLDLLQKLESEGLVEVGSSGAA